MRRPRSKLQVSTFPFLAVLLCAMGALLMLLFIMDRRAKIAARNQVSELHAKRQARTKSEEDAQQAEWEKARAALHQSLLDQQGNLVGDLKALQGSIDAANEKLNVVQARHVDLQSKIDGENAKVSGLHSQIASQQSGLVDAAMKQSMSKAERIAAEKELLAMELAYQQLRALKDRDKQTYSVVPYRGKQGDARPPIYVECVRDGILFHPEKKLFQGWEFSPVSIREEVERRHGPLALQKPKNDAATGPYVLFLIRPDGIANYYKAQSALKGYQLDFGYELVDQHWVLDFNQDAKSEPAGQLAADVPAPRLLPPSGSRAIDSKGGQPGSVNSLMPPSPRGGRTIGSGAGGPAGNSGPGSPLTLAPIAIPRTQAIDASSAKGASFTPITKLMPLVPVAPVGNPGGTGVNASPLPRTDSVGAKSPSTPGSPIANDEVPTNPGPRPLPVVGAELGKQPAPAAPIRTLANKDFVITVDCQSDAVNINPGGMAFRFNAANLQPTNDAMVQSVANLISRRQASVRPGDPPYRPLIRFQVSPAGLRTYYHVYPLLESLRVPMTRENIQE